VSEEPVKRWAVIELFGHQVIVGEMSEAELAGAGFIRVDVPEHDGVPAFTRFYGPKAIYALTPVSEEVARVMAQETNMRPVNVYSPALQERLLPASEPDEDDGPDWDQVV